MRLKRLYENQEYDSEKNIVEKYHKIIEDIEPLLKLILEESFEEKVNIISIDSLFFRKEEIDIKITFIDPISNVGGSPTSDVFAITREEYEIWKETNRFGL